jgi:hypothetical protein
VAALFEPVNSLLTMPVRNKSAKSGVFKKAAEWFKNPFRKQTKEVYSETDSDDYSSTSESESDSESYSESDSDICSKKHYIAGVSSQAHLVTPEQQSLNLRYPLRKNPKPSLKALEARETAEMTQRKKDTKPKASALKNNSVRQKNSTREQPLKDNKQVSITTPTAPPLYPSLPTSPSPVLPGYQPQSLSNPNFRYGNINDQTFNNSDEAQALAEQAVQILQGVAPRSAPFLETPTVHNTRGFRNLPKFTKSIHLKYNCSLRDASRWAQQLLDQGIDPQQIIDE